MTSLYLKLFKNVFSSISCSQPTGGVCPDNEKILQVSCFDIRINAADNCDFFFIFGRIQIFSFCRHKLLYRKFWFLTVLELVFKIFCIFFFLGGETWFSKGINIWGRVSSLKLQNCQNFCYKSVSPDCKIFKINLFLLERKLTFLNGFVLCMCRLSKQKKFILELDRNWSETKIH